MAVRTSSLTGSNSTDAGFRLWINEIHNSLIAFGWLQTADTGQINFTTVTRPVATSTYQGYAIYQMNDSLQSACPVFLRLDFGTGAGTDAPSVKTQICIGGTNGAGTLTGNITPSGFTIPTNSAAIGAFSCRTAGTTSSFRMAFFTNTALCFGFVVERDVNTSGVEQSTGINCLSWATGTYASVFLEQAGGTGAVDNKWYAFVSAQSSQAGGGNVGVGPVRTQLGPFRNPMKGMLLFSSTDFTVDTTGPVTIYGASHTYLFTRARDSAQGINSWNSNCGIALLWE